MHSKIRHNMVVRKTVVPNELESRYNDARDAHDSGVMDHKELDRKDPHMKSGESKPAQSPAPEGEC